MLFGTLYFVFCFIFCAFFGDRKKQMGRIILVISVFVAVFAVIFREQIISVVQLYLDRGMGNNGRYPLWERAFESFLESPVFGKGFYSLDLTTPNSFDKLSFDLVPDFAHNTIFELLGATGIVGFVAYSIYRVSTLVIAFRKPTAERIMLVMTALYIAFASLLDNFVFQIFSPVFYTVTMVMAVLIYEEDMGHCRGGKPVLSRMDIR
jgi:O-antigen ligase